MPTVPILLLGDFEERDSWALTLAGFTAIPDSPDYAALAALVLPSFGIWRKRFKYSDFRKPARVFWSKTLVEELDAGAGNLVLTQSTESRFKRVVGSGFGKNYDD